MPKTYYDPAKETCFEIAKWLELRLSWLTDPEMDADGADAVDVLGELHEFLKNGDLPTLPWN